MNNKTIPICRPLAMFWLCSLLSLLFSHLGDAVSVCNGIAILCSVLQFYPFYRLGAASERLRRAFILDCIGVGTVLLSYAFYVVPLPFLSVQAIGALVVIMNLITAAGVIATYVSQFWLYSELDSINIYRGYGFPPGLIRWCFYLSLLNIVLRPLSSAFPIMASQIISLILLGLFTYTVRKAENPST